MLPAFKRTHSLSSLSSQSVLPNGETSYHHVPVHAISFEANPSSYLIDHSIKLTISPFSDPTSYLVALCMQHPALPGALEVREIVKELYNYCCDCMRTLFTHLLAPCCR